MLTRPKFDKITFEKLNARQQENFNFHKIAAVLADYGYTSIRLTDDWEGADFLAQHINGKHILKIQLKGRLYFGQKYLGKNLYVAFRDGDQWYLYPHDELKKEIWDVASFERTNSWQTKKDYHFPSVPEKIRPLLEKYALKSIPNRGQE